MLKNVPLYGGHAHAENHADEGCEQQQSKDVTPSQIHQAMGQDEAKPAHLKGDFNLKIIDTPEKKQIVDKSDKNK